MSYYLGIDGGGTKTKATLFDERKKEISSFVGGALNIQIMSEDEMKKLFEEIVGFFKVDPQEIYLGIGAAGAGRESSREKLFSALREFNFKGLEITSDAHISLLATHGLEDGMLLISGTGSIAFGLKDKQLFRKGGWGHLLGDEGSGYFLGISLLKNFYKFLDRNKKIPEKISEKVFEISQRKNFDELVSWIYSVNKSEIAKLAKIVLENFQEEICENIIDESVNSLKELVLELRKETGLNSLGLNGGIVENDTVIRRRLVEELEREGIKIVPKRYSNEFGATLLFEK